MNMIKAVFFGLFLCMVSLVSAQHLTSPDGDLELLFRLDNGVPAYQLIYKNKTVITTSRLGLEMEEASLTGGFTQGTIRNTSFDETWTPVWGEYERIRNQYNEMLFESENQLFCYSNQHAIHQVLLMGYK